MEKEREREGGREKGEESMWIELLCLKKILKKKKSEIFQILFQMQVLFLLHFKANKETRYF